jgi:NADH:ubiquinone oxidoreductase subunit H
VHDTSSAVTAWSNFYVIVGSSAAALTGLLFIVITLIAGDRSRSTKEGIGTYTTPTIVHFAAALVIAATLCAPWRSLVGAAAAVALVGLFGVLYVLRNVIRQARQTRYTPDLDDWIWYGILPLIAYATVLVGALLVPAFPANTLFAVGGATMMLILIGIHNAWDVVTFIATGRLEEIREPGDDEQRTS